MYVLTENKLLKTGKDGEIIQKTDAGDTVPYADLNAGWVLNWKNESQKKYSLESETVGEKPKANACGFIPIITPLKAKNDDAQKTGDTVPYTDAVRASVHAAALVAGIAKWEKVAQGLVDVLLPIYEKHCPDDSRPHAAIERAKMYKKQEEIIKGAPKSAADGFIPIKLQAKPECDFDCKSLGMPEKKCDNCSYKPPF
jgi:hypothetical protein